MKKTRHFWHSLFALLVPEFSFWWQIARVVQRPCHDIAEVLHCRCTDFQNTASEIGLDSIGRAVDYDFVILLTRMISLKRFRLLGGSPSLSTVNNVTFALDRVSAKLESLDLSSGDYYFYTNHGGITSLSHSAALKRLCVQSRCYIGVFWWGRRIATPSGLLPVRLQQLDIHRHDGFGSLEPAIFPGSQPLSE